MMSGSKLTRSHSTLIPAAERVRRWAENVPEVHKIGAGIIKRTGSSRQSDNVKIVRTDTCLLLKVRGPTALQEVRLFSKKMEALERKLIRALPGLSLTIKNVMETA